MKNLKISLIAIFACLFVTSCSSSDDLGLGGSGGKSLSVKIDGSSFNASELTTSAIVTNGILTIQGGKTNGETLRVTIMNYTGAGTYKTGDNISNVNSMNYITLSPVATWSSAFDIGSGTLVVSSDSGSKVEGTFNFVGVNGSSSKNFTEGKFSIEY
jgi:hypothetical protein